MLGLGRWLNEKQACTKSIELKIQFASLELMQKHSRGWHGPAFPMCLMKDVASGTPQSLWLSEPVIHTCKQLQVS